MEHIQFVVKKRNFKVRNLLKTKFNFCIQSLPDKVMDNFVKLKMIKLANFKENIIGYIDGRDASSKLTVMNVKTNQVCIVDAFLEKFMF
jgi:hypothetical protein